MEEFDIIGPGDQPALLAISTPEVIGLVKTALAEMGYKVHVVENYEQFELRYNQVNYQIVVIEETFAGADSLENPALRLVQNLTMSLRRHAVIILVGPTVETLNTMQAFAQSVHCVINYSELQILPELVQKTVAENEMFLTTYRDIQRRVYQKPV
jgi:DNA-binding NtrC family response regulator